jgi:hypothetical protein
MCTYWQNTVYMLSVVIMKWRMGDGKPTPSSNIPYLPDFSTIFLQVSLSVFSYPTGYSICILCIYPHPAIYSDKPCHLVFHSIKNPKFYLNVISNNIVMICEGNGDIQPLIFRCFTGVT